MLRESIVHNHCFGINVAEEGGGMFFWFDVYSCIHKVGGSADLWGWDLPMLIFGQGCFRPLMQTNDKEFKKSIQLLAIVSRSPSEYHNT